MNELESSTDSRRLARRHAGATGSHACSGPRHVGLGAVALGAGATLAALAGLAVAMLFIPDSLLAQTQAAQPGQGARQMRHFWHVFAAYGIAWLLVFGWAVSIARRLARVEEKLGR